jgi:hypothetical protein
MYHALEPAVTPSTGYTMPALERDDQHFDEAGVDVLGEVRLLSFKAEPDHIGPFGASTLSWEVEGPASGFQVRLGALPVPRTGSQVFQPIRTTSYRLSAQAVQASCTLGTVTVTVDESGCTSYEPIQKPRVTYRGLLLGEIQKMPKVYFRNDGPTVTLSPGEIGFSLRLGYQQDYFVDPDVNMDVSFGLTVVDGVLVATGESISVSIDVPFWAWAVPGAVPGLAIAIDMARDKVRKNARDAITGLVALTNYFTSLVQPSGTRLRTVRVDAGNGGDGIIEVTFCPDGLLKRFAGISGLAVG